jgi:hypothetical protein
MLERQAGNDVSKFQEIGANSNKANPRPIPGYIARFDRRPPCMIAKQAGDPRSAALDLRRRDSRNSMTPVTTVSVPGSETLSSQVCFRSKPRDLSKRAGQAVDISPIAAFHCTLDTTIHNSLVSVARSRSARERALVRGGNFFAGDSRR